MTPPISLLIVAYQRIAVSYARRGKAGRGLNLSPDVGKITPFAAGEDIARFAVEDAGFEEVASAEIREAKPPLLDKAILCLLPLGQLAEITIKRLVAIRLPIGVFLMLLSDRLS